MLVVARVGQICRCVASEAANPYGLEIDQTYFQCQLQGIENIVGFEGDKYGFTNY